MAPKKRSIAKNKTNGKNPKKSKTETKTKEKVINETKEQTNNDLNIVFNEENNGLRRSKRVSNVKKPIETKSKFFNESEEEDNGIEEDLSEEEDEYKPEIENKVKPSIVNPKKNKRVKEDSENSSEEEDDWEEVKNNDDDEDEDPLVNYNPDIPTEGVQITLNESSVKKKKSIDINDLIRQRINRFKRDLQSDKHKSSLLLLIARAFHLNNSVNDQLIQSICLSITLNEFKPKPPKRLTLDFSKQFVVWFKNEFKLKPVHKTNESMIVSLIGCLDKREARNVTELNLTFLALFRSIIKKSNSRLVYALHPVALKPKDLMLSQKQMEAKISTKNSSKTSSPEQTNKSKQRASKSKKRKVVSSDSEDDSHSHNYRYLYIWVEIFAEKEGKWVSFDLSDDDSVDEPIKIAKKSLPQISYVIGLDSEGYIRDVTKRYTTDWMNNTFKNRRTDPNWWTQTLKPFQRKKLSAAEKAEENQFEEQLSSQPLPTKISEYKNHPLYVLKKDLLKFQGIYPSDAPPLGFIREEPVYARECVHLLHSRETWLRSARTVRVGESAYKLVKSRPKWDKYSKTWKRDLPLELFGLWQTEPYDPPEAKEGKVPRNGYGNVDLFMPCMIPKGCVHLQLPGLLRVANKLKIDCAPAVTGFDNNNGGLGSHPVIDGFIVCKEHEEVLIAAWEEDQHISKKRDEEKREKRVYENWRKLIKGLLIREKVKKKYNNSIEESGDDTDVQSD